MLCKDLTIRYLTTQDQVADIFTKGLSLRRFQLLISKFMVATNPISLRGPNNQDSSVVIKNTQETTLSKNN